MYEWLKDLKSPKMIVEAVKWIGTKELIGTANNPVILGWAREMHINDYTKDSIPWCGLFVAYVAYKCGKDEAIKAPLWARSWAEWGESSDPELGAVLVFQRDGGGHVGLYVGEDEDCYHVLGGNQHDSVCISRIMKNRMIACRAKYKNKPANVKKIILSPSGQISSNES